jgi:hypothetical protein
MSRFTIDTSEVMEEKRSIPRRLSFLMEIESHAIRPTITAPNDARRYWVKELSRLARSFPELLLIVAPSEALMTTLSCLVESSILL